MGLFDEDKEKIMSVMGTLSQRGIRWPKTEEWQDETGGKKKKAAEIFSVLRARNYDHEATVDALLEKFGQELSEKTKSAGNIEENGDGVRRVSDDSSPAKRKHEGGDDEPVNVDRELFNSLGIKDLKKELETLGGSSADCFEKSDLIDKIVEMIHKNAAAVDSKSKSKKPKKSETYVVEENREFGEVLMEIASLYYKASEARKAGVYSKAAKVVRECEEYLDTGKRAMKEKGIGKACGAMLDELKEKGFVDKLEKMRSGDA